MPQQLIEMDPPEDLRFRKTAKDPHGTEMLKLTNKTSSYVAFKVKTTAPKAYVVRPSSGTLAPNAAAQININAGQPGEGQGQNHRFLVQAHIVESAEQAGRDQWNSFKKEDVEEQRLSVVSEESADEPAAGKTSYQAGASPDAGRSPLDGEAPADLKQKYDELVKYTLTLEKQKKKLESDLAEVKAANERSSGDAGAYTKVHIILVALLVILLSYAANVLGKD